MTVRSFNKTGERFANEGEYSPNDIANDPLRFVKPTLDPTTTLGGPYTTDTCTPALPYASQENNNKFFDTPADVFQRHFFQRKPIDAGSVKILSNNISHLVYQQCRTLAVLNGPGTIGYKDSDRFLTTGSPTAIAIVQSPFADWTDETPRNWFREIGWSQYSSRRLGPFFGINDRKIEYNDDALNSVNLTNNASCIRKMILVIRGYKAKIPTVGGIYPDDARFHIHVVVTSDGGNPTDPATNIIPLFGQQRAYITECDGLAGPSARQEGPLPCPINSENRNDLFSGVPAYSVNLDWPSQANTTLEAPDASKTYDVFTGHYSAFIPIDCVGDITTTNASYLGTNVFQYYVHVGWLVGQPSMAISSITLLEVRDPGSAEAS
jgi:hypothetical protein